MWYARVNLNDIPDTTYARLLAQGNDGLALHDDEALSALYVVVLGVILTRQQDDEPLAVVLVDDGDEAAREQLLLDWSALLREFDRRASLESTISSASDVLISYERQYFSGLKTWLEVLNAVQELSQSQLRLAQAGNATTLAYYRWRLRGGELPHHADWTR